MAINWIFNSLVFIFILKIKGNQWIIPDIMAKTAPIERT